MTRGQIDSRSDGIATDISKVESVVATARRLLTEGKMVDLSALQNKVGEICVSITGLCSDLGDGKAAAPLLPRLEALMEDLDALSTDLDAQHNILSSEEATPLSAAQAYSAPQNKDTD